MRPSLRSLGLGSLLSLLVHWLLVVVLPAWRGAATGNDTAIEFELSPLGNASDTTANGAVDFTRGRVEPEPGGRESVHNIDARDRGKGGDARGAHYVIRLLPRASGISLSDAPMNTVDSSQAQRIETAPDRASLEDRRATPHPDDQPFLASGSGLHPQRRPVALRDAQPGAAHRRSPAQRNLLPTGDESATSTSLPAIADPINSGSRGTGGQSATGPGEPNLAGPSHAHASTQLEPNGAEAAPTREGQSEPLAEQSVPGPGIVGGLGTRARLAANVAHGRPPVDEARAATTTESRDERVRDDRSSELLVASPRQSVVESTERVGIEPTPGAGGIDAGGAAGTGGGEREGGRAFALGPGRGSWDVLDTGSERYRTWLLRLKRGIERQLEFPRARAVAMDQGVSVYSLSVRRDGSLASRPRLVRSSGFDDFDDAARSAIDRCLPFARLPEDLVPARPTIEVLVPVEFVNPMVR